MTPANSKIWETRPIVMTGVCWWNLRSVKAMFKHLPDSVIVRGSFKSALQEAKRKDGCLLSWASRHDEHDAAACKAARIPLIAIEDGFLRSVGLGAGLTPAASLVLDSRGIYYDSNHASDLEWMLENVDLTQDECARGASLKTRILEARVSKYNVGNTLAQGMFPIDRRKLLVPGQVADDAAITKTRSDSIDLNNYNINHELLRVARKNNPDAYIVYKPHPDVTSDLRKGALANAEALQFADQIISNVDIIDVIEACDDVETLTSLAGFEALLRGKNVVVHGLPFYAGWGLTKDTTTTPRRTRNRSIDELVYLTLIAYSHYVDPISFNKCEPEDFLKTLQTMRNDQRLKIVNAMRLWVAWGGDKLNPYT